jgi:hypothetical protein
MQSTKWFWPSLSLFALAALLAVNGCGGGGRSEVLAQVGKEKITSRDLDQALANLPGQYHALAMSSKGKHQILDNLVKKSLLIQEAKRRGLPSDPEVKAKIKDTIVKGRKNMEDQLVLVKSRLASLDRDVMESVLLSELNTRLKQDKQQQSAVSDEDVQAYYEAYVHKLKALNPAAKPPALENVSAQIRAVLVEERLLADLEKKDKVSVSEDVFQKRYGEKGEDVTIQENSGSGH